ASAVDGLVEQITPQLGMLAPPDDPDRLAEAIVRLRRSDLTLMGAMARRSVSGDWQRHLTAWRRLYARLAQPAAPFHSTWRNWRADIARGLLRDATEIPCHAE